MTQLDLDGCAQEPVHNIGQIQPHGVLFAMSEPDLLVWQVSANVAAVLGMAPETVLGRSFEAVLGRAQFQLFQQALSSASPHETPAPNALQLRVGVSEIDVQCIAHRQDGVLIAELDLLAGVQYFEPLNLGVHLGLPLEQMELASSLVALSQLAANQTRRLSGFDRVMVYRFDEEWNGEVIAESLAASQASYLGLRFPASDIPAQARRLFLVNRLRTIVDIYAAPVPIISEVGPEIGRLTGRPLDLTSSLLRSAAPVHLEYLRNMGVRSSLTVSIIVEQRLWGIIACHHSTPRHVDYGTRSLCELIGRMMGAQVALRIENSALRLRMASTSLLQGYVAGIDPSQSLVYADHFHIPRLLELFGADALVMRIDGVLSWHGSALVPEALLPVVGKLRELSSDGIASSNMLSALHGGAGDHLSQVSGGLYIGLTEDSGDYLLLLRRELVETVVWAGNPDKSLSLDEQGKLRPRASFAAWQEIVRGRSRSWSGLELENARLLREQLRRLKDTLAALKVQKARSLFEGDKRFRLLADAMPQLIWTARPDGKTDYFNQRWIGYTDSNLEPAQPGAWAKAIHPDDLASAAERWARTLATGCDYEVEYRVKRALDGAYRWHLARAFPLLNDKNELVQWVGTCTDIEDQKQARHALESGVAERTAELTAAREQLQMVLDGATNVSIIAGDRQGVITLFNSGAQNMLGYTAEEIVGKQTPGVFHLESEVTARGLELTQEMGKPVEGFDVFVERARNGRPEEHEWTYVRKDGSHLPVHLVVTALRDPAGTIVGFLGIATDLSARKRAEAAARASAEHFRLIVETVEDYALIMLDTEGRVISWNIGAQRINGYRADEIMGRHFSCFYQPDDIARKHPDEELSIAAKHGRYTEEGWRVRKDGSRYLADVFIARILDDNGKLLGFAKVVHDITERKRSEERFQLVVEAAPSAMLMVDANRLITLVNTQTEKLFGFDRHELLGQPMEMLLPERFRLLDGGLMSGFAAAPNGPAMGAGQDLFGLRKDGSEVPVEIRLNPMTTSQGQFVLASIIDTSHRKKAEQSLREQAFILDMANDSIFIRDSQDRLTYWNQGAQTLYGWRKEEVLGRVTHSLLATKFPQYLGDVQAQLFETGHWRGELVHTCRDGALVTVASSWTLRQDESNGSFSVLEVNHDITARKQTEDRLNDYAARLGLATHILRAGIWDWDLRTNAVVWDETMHEIYGLAEHLPVTYQFWADRVVAEDRAEAEGVLQNAIASKSQASGEFRIILPNGSIRHIQAAHAVVLDDAGKVVRMVGVNLDATTRKLNERQAVERSAQLEAANDLLKVVVRRLKLATDALHAGIWDWDIRSDEIVWDQRMFEIYGISSDTQPTYPVWASAVVPEDLPAAEATLQRVIASKSQGSAEFRIRLRNGSLRYIQAAEGAILDDAGEVIRVIGINIDTTGRKFNEDLERQVGERTAELKAVNKELEEFAYAASHDLKAPLRVINNATKWLEKDLKNHLTGSASESLDLVRSRVKRMDKLLDDLLEYARIGRSTDNRFLETISGDRLMSDVLALLAPGDLTLKVSPSFAGIQLCRMPLQQILMNLIGNAIKHHDKQTGTIEVTVEEQGDDYAIAVKDDGPGIPAQFHDQIFEMFQTLKPRDLVEGSGMGLATVRKNIEVFGGVLKLESIEGQGSVFRFTWPKQQRLSRREVTAA